MEVLSLQKPHSGGDKVVGKTPDLQGSNCRPNRSKARCSIGYHSSMPKMESKNLHFSRSSGRSEPSRPGFLQDVCTRLALRLAIVTEDLVKGSVAKVHARKWKVKRCLGETQTKNLRESTLNPTTHTHKVEAHDQPGLALRLRVGGVKPP